MTDLVRLTVVASQGEADVICSLLRANGIHCGERATDLSQERGGGYGGWREVLVRDDDVAAARDLIASTKGRGHVTRRRMSVSDISDARDR